MTGISQSSDNGETARSNSLICPCCRQQVEGAVFLADAMTSTVTNGDRTIQLTRQQFKLAKHLIDRFPMMATKDGIYDAVFMDACGDGPDMKIIDVMICKIRPALAEVGLVIETVWGSGYKIVEADPEKANAIKEAGIRSLRGNGTRWTRDYDETLRGLMARKLKPAACASIMRLPYMTVERHYKRLLELDGEGQ